MPRGGRSVGSGRPTTWPPGHGSPPPCWGASCSATSPRCPPTGCCRPWRRSSRPRRRRLPTSTTRRPRACASPSAHRACRPGRRPPPSGGWPACSARPSSGPCAPTGSTTAPACSPSPPDPTARPSSRRCRRPPTASSASRDRDRLNVDPNDPAGGVPLAPLGLQGRTTQATVGRLVPETGRVPDLGGRTLPFFPPSELPAVLNVVTGRPRRRGGGIPIIRPPIRVTDQTATTAFDGAVAAMAQAVDRAPPPVAFVGVDVAALGLQLLERLDPRRSVGAARLVDGRGTAAGRPVRRDHGLPDPAGGDVQRARRAGRRLDAAVGRRARARHGDPAADESRVHGRLPRRHEPRDERRAAVAGVSDRPAGDAVPAVLGSRRGRHRHRAGAPVAASISRSRPPAHRRGCRRPRARPTSRSCCCCVGSSCGAIRTWSCTP